MAGDGGVARLPGQGRVGVVAGPSLEVVRASRPRPRSCRRRWRGCGCGRRRRPRRRRAAAGRASVVVAGGTGRRGRLVGRGHACVPEALLELVSRAGSAPAPRGCRCPRAGRRRTAGSARPTVMQVAPDGARGPSPAASSEGIDPRPTPRTWPPRCWLALEAATAGQYPRGVAMEPVVHLRAAVALLGRFPALAGIDLDVARGEIVLLRGPERRRQDHAAARLRGPRPGRARRGGVLGHDLRARRPAGPPPGRAAGPRHGLYDDLTVADNVRFWGRAAGADARRHRRRAWPLSASTAGCATCRWPACRPASGAAPRSPACWPAGPSCGCSTSPTPGSTTTPATCSTAWSRQAVGRAPPCCSSSHELDRAEALADRVVDDRAGGTTGPRFRSRDGAR